MNGYGVDFRNGRYVVITTWSGLVCSKEFADAKDAEKLCDEMNAEDQIDAQREQSKGEQV